MERFRKQVEQYRLSVGKGLSYNQLAKLLDTNPGTIWKFLHGGKTYREEFVTAFARIKNELKKKDVVDDVVFLLPELSAGLKWVACQPNGVWKAFASTPVPKENRGIWTASNDLESGTILSNVHYIPKENKFWLNSRFEQLLDGWERRPA